jgi:hypothetical protein
MILDHVPTAERAAVVTAMETCLTAWQAYRDEVAASVGLAR